MGDEITKEELKIMLDMMSRYASNLENIANSIRTNCEALREINERLHNGMIKEFKTEVMSIIDSHAKLVLRNHEDIKQNQMKILANTDDTKTDVYFTKWFVGIVGIVIIIATVILRGIDNRQLLGPSMESKVQTIIENEFRTKVSTLLQREFENYRSKNNGS